MKRLLRILLGWLFSLDIRHEDRLKFTGPSIIMPNHVSFLDPIFLYMVLPETACFVVNSAIARNPIVRLGLRFCRHIEMDMWKPYSLRSVMSVVSNGGPVVLFPEGRITTTGGLMKMYAGAAMVAAKTQAQIFPVILLGPEFSAFSRIKEKVRTRWLPKVQLFAGTPYRLSVGQGVGFREQRLILADKLLSAMQEAVFAARQECHAGQDFMTRLQFAAKQYGEGKTIVRDTGGSVTYRELIAGICALSEKLRTLLPETETSVGLLLPNSIAHVLALFALIDLEKAPALLNFSTGTQNVVNCADNAGVKTILTSRTFIEKGGLGALANRLSENHRLVYLEDVAAMIGKADKLAGLWREWRGICRKSRPNLRLILFTSGTEGNPKGVVLSHAAVLANIDQVASIIDYTPADRMLTALPMFHGFGLMAGALLPLLSGLEVYLYPSPLHYRIVPEVAYDFNATIMLGTSTFFAGYGKAAHPYDFHSMRYALAGGEKLRDSVRALWQEKFGLRVLEGYGVTETAPVLCLNTPLATKAGSVGRFLPGIEYRIEPVEGVAEGGKLLVRGPNRMEGYLLYEKGFQPAGEWYDTGDVVTVDADRFVTIQARLKRFAKIAGEMINLQLVEAATAACWPGYAHAALAVGGGSRGEKIILFTTFKAPERQYLREYLQKQGQSALYLPEEIRTLDKMPLLGSGKPDYLTLRHMSTGETA